MRYEFLMIASIPNIYRIRVYKTSLLIKPPLLENSIEIQINRHFFAQKSSFWGFFEQKLEKFHSYFNKPPPQTLDFFISRRRLIDADTVVRSTHKLKSIIKIYRPTNKIYTLNSKIY